MGSLPLREPRVKPKKRVVDRCPIYELFGARSSARSSGRRSSWWVKADDEDKSERLLTEATRTQDAGGVAALFSQIGQSRDLGLTRVPQPHTAGRIWPSASSASCKSACPPSRGAGRPAPPPDAARAAGYSTRPGCASPRLPRALRSGDQQYGLARAGHAIDDAMTIPQANQFAGVR